MILKRLPTHPTYSVILADPPWKYRVRTQSRTWGTADSHYPTMSVEQITSLPIRRFALPNSALFLWCPPPCFQEAMTLFSKWGFEYKTRAFLWVKLTRNKALWFGLGHYTRANAEDVLLGVRGSMKRKRRDVPQVIISEMGSHSTKPTEVHRRIELMYDGPYLELFARRARPGWDVWGNEVGQEKGVFKNL